MPVGLFALLDDVAGIAKVAAASLDDVSAAATRAGAKTAGVLIDDTAVTPRFVTGLSPDRELPVIARIARGSVFNKLVILLPAALLLSWFLPGAITPLLMFGGAYLSYEASEKIGEALSLIAHGPEEQLAARSTAELETKMVAGAVRTDLILSAEIMTIALASIEVDGFWARAIVLALVALGVTAGVYGVVGLIVKLDDIGLALCRRGHGWMARAGHGLVRAMPRLLGALEVIGTAAMLWVGGGIVLHGLEQFIPAVHHGVGAAVGPAEAALGPAAGWLLFALLSALLGLVIGAPLVAAMLAWQRRRTP